MTSDNNSSSAAQVPVEVEIYINTDGSVTFADLAAEVIPIAMKLNPEEPIRCGVSDTPQADLTQS